MTKYHFQFDPLVPFVSPTVYRVSNLQLKSLSLRSLPSFSTNSIKPKEPPSQKKEEKGERQKTEPQIIKVTRNETGTPKNAAEKFYFPKSPNRTSTFDSVSFGIAV